MARTAAGSCSGMDEYELHGHLSEQLLRLIGGYFVNFYSSVSGISEEIYFQQAVYFSYTSIASKTMHTDNVLHNRRDIL